MSVEERAVRRERYVAKSAELGDGERLVVSVDGALEVGIFREDGQLYAYENLCPHAGGPVCQGLRIPEVVEVLDDERCSRGFEFAEDSMLITCPWHGFEFRIDNGEHTGDPTVRLTAVEVMERHGDVYIVG